MLTRTFIHISGVGPQRELAIWRAGIRDWADFIERGQELLPPGLFRQGLPVVRQSLAALERPGGLAELAKLIPPAEHWRFWPTFGRVAYLDIETGGDADDWGGITVVGIYDGQEARQFVAGRDLHEVDQAMAGMDIVCTFAGSSFDLPVLRGVFGRLAVPPVHIDLRWALKRLGHSGGLKRIERALGLARPNEVADFSGWDAVRLWRDHLAGDPAALPLLLEYNAQDILNLEPLLALAHKELTRRISGRAGWQNPVP